MALFFLAYTLFGWLRHRPATAPVASTWTHRIIERGGGITWLVLFNLTGASMFLRFGGGLYLLAVVMFFMLLYKALGRPRRLGKARRPQASPSALQTQSRMTESHGKRRGRYAPPLLQRSTQAARRGRPRRPADTWPRAPSSTACDVSSANRASRAM